MSDGDRIVSILGDWQERRDRGEDVDPEEVIAEHPDLADALRAKFEALAPLDATKAGAARSASPTRLRELPLDRYADFRPAGEGGMGIVYWAIDTDLNREVAFKVIRPGVQEEDATTPAAPVELSAPAKDTPASQAFETLKQRFLQEAWVTGGLSHPGIVPVYELGQTPEGVPYYTMRFVKGERTLADAIEEVKDKDVEERLKLIEPFLKICDTLSYAHAKGVIHRDLKPDNIALGEFGEVVVIDWGLAKIKDRPDVTQERWQDRIQEYREATDLRTVASAMGTPGYMAPEAAKGQADRMDARSDVYSLGAILFQILTGRLPFEFTTFVELVTKLLKEEPPKATDVADGVPAALSELCARCLATDADLRPRNADEVVKAIRAWQSRSAVDREVEGLLRDASSSLETARKRAGDARIEELDRVVASCSRILTLRPDHRRAQELQAEVAGLREQGTKEREQAARRRTLVRVGTAVGILGVVAAAVVVWVLDERRREADKLREVAVAERDAKSQALLQKSKALRQARGLGLASAAREAMGVSHMRALLLARSAVRAEEAAPTVSVLVEALVKSREVVALTGHERRVNCASFSPDGNRILTASDDGTARLWDLGGQELAVLAGHEGEVLHAGFSPDGSAIVTTSKDSTARLWDLDGQEVAILRGHGDYGVQNAVFSPDGTRVVTASRDHTARLWDREGQQLAVLRGHTSFVWSAVFTPCGTRIVTGSSDGTNRLWNLDGEEVAVFRQGRRSFLPPPISPDGQRILTVLGDTARLWDLDGQEVAVLRGHEGEVRYVAFSHDGTRIASSAEDGTARLWSLDGQEVALFPTSGAGVSAAEPLPNGKLILTYRSGTTARILDPDGKETAVLRLPEGGVGTPLISPDGERILIFSRVYDLEGREVAVLRGGSGSPVFSPDSSTILTVGGGGTARLWDLSGTGVAVLRAREGAIRSPRISPDGTHILTTSDDDTAQVWGIDGRRVAVLRGHEGRVHRAAFSPNGTRILTASIDATVRLWDVHGQEIAVLPVHGVTKHATFSPDGTQILTVGAPDRVARLWDLDGRMVAVLRGHTDWVRDAAFSPDGTRIVTAGGKTARLWDLDGREVAVLRGHEDVVWHATFSPDGTRILTASAMRYRLWDLEGQEVAAFFGQHSTHPYEEFSADGTRILTIHDDTARLWDLSGRELVVFRGHKGWLNRASFSPDGTRVVTASKDNTARLWDLDGREIAVLHAHEQSVTHAVFSPDGTRIVTASEDKTVRLWDPTGHEIAVLRGHEGHVLSATFTPDGTRIVSASKDGSVRLWLSRTEDLLRLADRRITRDFTDAEKRRYGPLLGTEE